MMYHLSDLDELMEYMWLKQEKTGLPTDIFVDDGLACLRHNHPLLLYARNGSAPNDEYLPVSIADAPQLLDSSMNVQIAPSQMERLFAFIRMNQQLLIDLANKNISQEDFINSLTLCPH